MEIAIDRNNYDTLKEYNGFEVYSNVKQGLGHIHVIVTTSTNKGLNIGKFVNAYRHAVYPASDIDEIIHFLDNQKSILVIEFLNKYGDYSLDSFHIMWTWEKFKQNYLEFLETKETA